MAEIPAGERETAERLTYFKDSITEKYYQRVRDEDTADLIQDLIDLINAGALVWQKFTVTIPASSTVVVDTNLLSSFSRIDYILNFKNSPVTVTKSLKCIFQNNGGNLTDSVSERMGGPINVAVNGTDDSVDAFLEISNNESFPLTMTFLRSII